MLVIRVADVFMCDTNEGSIEFLRAPYGDTLKICQSWEYYEELRTVLSSSEFSERTVLAYSAAQVLSPPAGTNVKNKRNCTSVPPGASIACVGTTLPLPSFHSNDQELSQSVLVTGSNPGHLRDPQGKFNSKSRC